MSTEKEKMLSGALYNALDAELSADRQRARTLMQELNQSGASAVAERNEIIKDLLPNAGANIWIEPPFYCDYGTNIKTGENVFFNFNCVVLDVALVTIGSRVLFGPNVQIYTATHPLDFKERATGLESAKQIVIGDDVWIGGGVIINPGITVGSRSVIGSGSVVTKNIPADVVAAGNPCMVIRALNNAAEIESSNGIV